MTGGVNKMGDGEGGRRRKGGTPRALLLLRFALLCRIFLPVKAASYNARRKSLWSVA